MSHHKVSKCLGAMIVQLTLFDRIIETQFEDLECVELIAGSEQRD